MQNRLPSEIITDGQSVWVNAPICIGRFSSRGCEIYQLPKPDATADDTEWIPPNWNKWCRRMYEVHQVIVPKSMRPKWVPNPDG